MSRIKIFGLGGLNESGKNTYIVEVDEKIFVLDCGLKYATDRMYGIDYIIPNFNYLKENITSTSHNFYKTMLRNTNRCSPRIRWALTI